MTEDQKQQIARWAAEYEASIAAVDQARVNLSLAEKNSGEIKVEFARSLQYHGTVVVGSYAYGTDSYGHVCRMRIKAFIGQ